MKMAATISGFVVAVTTSLLFIGCGGSSSSRDSTGIPAGETVSVDMTGSHSFSPSNATVSAGDTVNWINTDTARHTVASDNGVSGMNSDSQFPTGLPGSSTFSWRVPANTPSGKVFYYHCKFHGAAGDGSHVGTGMAGTLTVR